MKLHRFWVVFASNQAVPVGAKLGCGVTAEDKTVALTLIKKHMFSGREIPAIKEIRCRISLDEIDQKHVRPNMGNPTIKGIWFPLGYEERAR